jgi:hypothetical protein
MLLDAFVEQYTTKDHAYAHIKKNMVASLRGHITCKRL